MKLTYSLCQNMNENCKLSLLLLNLAVIMIFLSLMKLVLTLLEESQIHDRDATETPERLQNSLKESEITNHSYQSSLRLSYG